MKKSLTFYDYHKALLLDEDQNDFLFSFGSDTPRKYRTTNIPEGAPQTIKARIEATHSGKVTLNNSFYLPEKMRSGASTFLTPFQKPILTHHNKEEDAIGRVISARYVDIPEVSSFLRRPQDSLISDNLLDAFIKGKLPLNNQIDLIRDLFLDYEFVKNENYPGLGFIELTASITDPDAAAKVWDQRYLTGSIGATTDAAICSICKTDWMSEDGDICEHYPGEIYDGKLCVIVAGNLNYKEYSYVNSPADVHSKNVEIWSDGENTIDWNKYFDKHKSSKRIPEVGLILDFQQEDKELSSLPPKDLPQIEISDEELTSLNIPNMYLSIVKDSLLTVEEKAHISDSYFCGENRSFLVNDPGHFYLSLAQLEGYEGSDKEAIRERVLRKGKRLGCSVVPPPEGKFILDYFDNFSDEEMNQLLTGLDKALIERGLKVEQPDHTEELQQLRLENAEQKDYISSLQDQLAELIKEKQEQKPVSVDNKETPIDNEEKTEDPTLGLVIKNKVSEIPETPKEIVLTDEVFKQIAQTAIIIRMTQGEQACEDYIKMLTDKGIIPSNTL